MFYDIYIGQSHWVLHTDFPIKWDEEGLQFTIPNPDSSENYNRQFQLQAVKDLPGIGGQPNVVNQIRRIYLQDGQEAREYLIAATDEVYGIYAEMDREKPMILLDANRPELFQGNGFLFNYFALERNLLIDNQIILHSCFIIHNGQAILFTAPSETGKSTQGNHWEQLYGAEVVNGDRALLGKKEGVWKAYGSPFSGTSGICKNLQAPVKAIVYLHQAPHNHIKSLSGIQAFQKLYEQITINNWNPDFTENACNLLEDLVISVPVYEYELTKEKESALYLHNYFETAL